MPAHAYRIEHHAAGTTVALGFCDATGVPGDVLAPVAARLLAARVRGVLTLVEQSSESVVASRALWSELGEEGSEGADGEVPDVAAFPLTLAGMTYSRDEVIDRCADQLVEAALNGEPSVDPNPAVSGPVCNARGFSVFGLEAASGARVILTPADLAEVIARARAELLRTLGYIPRGRRPGA